MRASTILAIESSCDETAVALVSENGFVRAQQLFSQIEIHREFGGVVPEVASRYHYEVLDGLVKKLFAENPDARSDIRAVAATCAPGLIGPLIVGASYAQGLASGWELPFIGVHHLRGHLASVLLQQSDSGERASLREQARNVFPALVLLVSGGHTQVLAVDESLRAQPLAQSADDAAGECFDKAAKLMGLPYPGGPQIEALAQTATVLEREEGAQLLARLPRPRSVEGFSFSGLKTAIRLQLEKNPKLACSPAFCWALQEAISQSLVQGLSRALEKLANPLDYSRIVFCGGVAANQRIRQSLFTWAQARGMEVVLPPLKYCTDNAAMIAAAAWVQDDSLALHDIQARRPL